MVGDPDFEDPSQHDFSLRAGCDAIDRSNSADEGIYDLYFSTYGESIRYDKAGNPRPADFSKWDLGAFEYSDGIFQDGFELGDPSAWDLVRP